MSSNIQLIGAKEGNKSSVATIDTGKILTKTTVANTVTVSGAVTLSGSSNTVKLAAAESASTVIGTVRTSGSSARRVIAPASRASLSPANHFSVNMDGDTGTTSDTGHSTAAGNDIVRTSVDFFGTISKAGGVETPAGTFTVEYSHNGTTFFKTDNFPTTKANGDDCDYYIHLTSIGAKFVRVLYTLGSGEAITIGASIL